MSPSDWDGLVVVCATTPWDGVPLGDRHLAGELARTAPLLYVDPPVPLHRAGARPIESASSTPASERVEVLRPGLARLRPRVVPGHERPLMKQVAIRQTRRAIAHAVAELGGPRVRAMIVPSLNRYFGAADEELSIFHAKDDYVAGAGLMGTTPARLRRPAERQPAEADLVLAASPALADAHRALGREVLLLPNGCDADAFSRVDEAPPARDVPLEPPIAGYVGQLSARIDLTLLERLADEGVSLLLVGPRTPTVPLARLADLVWRPNVVWVGAQPFAALPSYLRLVHVGLVPYDASAFNLASFPLKALEYLAAGRPVVATDLPALRWLDAPDLVLAADREAFVAATLDALARRPDPGAAGARRAFARSHSWRTRAATLASVLGIDDGAAAPVGQDRRRADRRALDGEVTA